MLIFISWKNYLFRKNKSPCKTFLKIPRVMSPNIPKTHSSLGRCAHLHWSCLVCLASKVQDLALRPQTIINKELDRSKVMMRFFPT